MNDLAGRVADELAEPLDVSGREVLEPDEAMDEAIQQAYLLDLDSFAQVSVDLSDDFADFVAALYPVNEGDPLVAEVDGQPQHIYPGGQVRLVREVKAFDGTMLAVGARWNDEAGVDAGAVYLYEKIGAEWVPASTPKLTPKPSGADSYRFGEGTIGLDRGRLMVSAPSAPSGAQVNAYALDESGAWTPEVFDPPPGLSSRIDPGWRTAIKGDDAIVVGTSNDVGLGLHYRYSGGAWRIVQLLESGFASNDVFGWTIAYDGSTACFGAIFYGDKDGAAFFFDLPP